MREFCIFWKLFLCLEIQGKSNILVVGCPQSPSSPPKRPFVVLTWLFHSCILFPPNSLLGRIVLAAKKKYRLQLVVIILKNNLLYNRALDLIQEFRNIKQNNYKSQEAFEQHFLRKSCQLCIIPMWIPTVIWSEMCNFSPLLDHWPVFKSCNAMTTRPRSLYHVNRSSKNQAN